MKRSSILAAMASAAASAAVLGTAAGWESWGVTSVAGIGRPRSTTPPTEKAKWRADMVAAGTFKTEYLGLMPHDGVMPTAITRQMRRRGLV